jgi:hypothetical protein
MLQEIQGQLVTVYLNLSPIGNYEVKGEAVEFNDTWLKLKGKKTVEFISIDTIKRITVHIK